MLSTIFLNLGCARKMPSDDLIVGTYVISYSHGSERLELRKNRTFDQRYSTVDGVVTENTGTWSILDDPPSILLKNALLNDDRKGHRRIPAVKSFWILGIDRISGEIKLTVDNEGILAFRKQ